MTNRIWRGGMIGAGAWSEVQLTAWERVENAQIVALCDRHHDRRERVRQRFNLAHTFASLEAMLDGTSLDFVDICTRPYSHAALTKLAAGRRLPVLCQKPFCEELEEARELVEFCASAGVRLMINENFRWQAWYRQAKALLDSGALGKPFFATIRRRSRVTLPKFEQAQSYFAEMPRLILYESGIHYLDTSRFLFGEPVSVFARTHHISDLVQGEDVLSITLAYDHMTSLIIYSWASVPVPGLDRSDKVSDIKAPRLEIDGTEGTLRVNCDGSLHLITDNDHRRWEFSRNIVSESHATAQQHFIDCLEGGVEFETGGADYLKTMALVYACYQSAEKGRVVDLRQTTFS